MLVSMKKPINPSLAADIRRGRALRSRGGTNDRSSASAAGLPDGWQEATTADGKPYYFSNQGETSWTRPTGGKTALAVKPRPVVPNLESLGKLPQGWRMVTSEDGKVYYYHKKSGECSWTPPPPDGGAPPKPNMAETWRRTKQQAAVRVFRAKASSDGEMEAMYERLVQLDALVHAIKASMEAHTAALVEMLWSGEELSQKLADYTNEPGSKCAESASQAARLWKDLRRGATRSLEQQLTAKVTQPVNEYLGEIEGIKQMRAEYVKRTMDYDYYRRKVTELNSKPQRDMVKVERNTEKLAISERAYTAISVELKARLAALLQERWDFISYPQLHLMDFHQQFFTTLAGTVQPLSAYTSQSNLLNAEARCFARATLKTELLAKPPDGMPPTGPPPGGHFAAAPPPGPPGGAYQAASPFSPRGPPPPGPPGGPPGPPSSPPRMPPGPPPGMPLGMPPASGMPPGPPPGMPLGMPPASGPPPGMPPGMPPGPRPGMPPASGMPPGPPPGMPPGMPPASGMPPGPPPGMPPASGMPPGPPPGMPPASGMPPGPPPGMPPASGMPPGSPRGIAPGGSSPPPPPPGAPAGGMAGGSLLAMVGARPPPPPPGGGGGGTASAAAPRPPPPLPKPAMPPRAPQGTHRAVSDYAATDSRMISMAKGEVLIKEKEESGWYFGTNARGDKGYFPASYVEPI
ncbi:hypothetical protein AB1Y20_014371 [Prymnesium parvum]|uniref:Uncharacterized protein n=1 Tax=Prymnesium parvum TaxID=97485 RepID=A0AB34IFM1_PRYPA